MENTKMFFDDAEVIDTGIETDSEKEEETSEEEEKEEEETSEEAPTV